MLRHTYVTSYAGVSLRDALDAVLAGRPVPNPDTKALGCYIVPPDILRK